MLLKYRPEIDGLRAIAVLSVIIYHAEFSNSLGIFLKGGFLGVDVFFVISGFLITSIIMGEYEKTGGFSIGRFYERRARRILPALLVVMLACIPFAWQFMLPEQFVDFSKSLLSSIFFGSNFYWDISLQEYGAESALIKPLLHTWSLAVEEQYYIIYPLLLVAIYKYCRIHVIVLLAAGLLLSLQFAEWMTARDASFSFYMLPSRFWELLAGALLANILYLHPQKNNDALLNRTMPILGLYLIIYSVFFIDFDSRHPGFITLIPVIGTILIIWFANDNDLVTRMLSSKYLVSIGLISYSLYLWHYPIFAFGRILEADPTVYEKAVWIFATCILSVITYYLIERPFRNKTRVSKRALLFSMVSLSSLLIGTSLYIIEKDGVKERLGYLYSVLTPAKIVDIRQDGRKCHSEASGNSYFGVSESCVFEYASGSRYIILIGDSHARSLARSVREMAKINGYNFIQVTAAGCHHLVGYGNKECRARSRELLGFLKKYPHSIIVYSSRIPTFMEWGKFDNEEGDQESGYKPVSRNTVVSNYRKRARIVFDSLNSWVQQGHDLMIVYPVPEQGFSVGSKLFTQRPFIKNRDMLPDLSTSYDVFKKRVRSSYIALNRITGSNVYRVYPEKIFCDENVGRCYATKGDKIYFASDNHLSPLGASMVVAEIKKKLGLK